MLVCEEPNVDVLRQKARVLERENERLTSKVSELLREVCALKGMPATAIELNLPGLTAQAAGKPSAGATRPGSERRVGLSPQPASGERKPRQGHGPTKQPELEHIADAFDVDTADKQCTLCGGTMSEWTGKADSVEVVDRIPAKWIVRQCTLKKYRCKCGGCVETAAGPQKLIPGGRYALGVALASSSEKFLDHLPIERQARMAQRLGMRITSQALWDQQLALADLFAPLVRALKLHLLEQPVIGADLSPFKLIKKGGATKWQVWQLSCPSARFFEMLDTKAAAVGRSVFEVRDDEQDTLIRSFRGTMVSDGAAELLSLSKTLGFGLANCWSHGRRAVLEAKSEAPGQVQEFLDLVGRLYEIERKAAPDGADRLPGGYRKHQDLQLLGRLRQTESAPLIELIKTWMLEQKCIPGGILKKKLAYIAGRWSGLTRFLSDPLVPLDNNGTEGGYIGLGIGRRNYVGCRSERGMRVAATFYTVYESARVCGVHPDEYMRYAAETLLAKSPPVLPHEWVRANGSPETS